jgi:hypothetical protein
MSQTLFQKKLLGMFGVLWVEMTSFFLHIIQSNLRTNNFANGRQKQKVFYY